MSTIDVADFLKVTSTLVNDLFVLFDYQQTKELTQRVVSVVPSTTNSLSQRPVSLGVVGRTRNGFWETGAPPEVRKGGVPVRVSV